MSPKLLEVIQVKGLTLFLAPALANLTIKISEVAGMCKLDNKPHLKVGQKPEEIRISKKLKKINQL